MKIVFRARIRKSGKDEYWYWREKQTPNQEQFKDHETGTFKEIVSSDLKNTMSSLDNVLMGTVTEEKMMSRRKLL